MCSEHLMQLIRARLLGLICNRSGSFFTVGLCFLCKHRNVIKTKRSGFLISISADLTCFGLLVHFAVRNQEKAWECLMTLDEFSFSLRNWCIHAACNGSSMVGCHGLGGSGTWFLVVPSHRFSNTFSPQPLRSPFNDKRVYWKRKFMTLCLA